MTSAFLRSTALVLAIVAYASACGIADKGERKQPVTRIKTTASRRKNTLQPVKVVAVDRRQMTREVIQ